MGAKSGRDDTSLRGAALGKHLYDKISRFEFFQAVRLLRKLHPDRASVGRDSDPGREVVRFRSDFSYAFPTGDIRSLESSEDESPDEMVVNFLGIATPASFGSLPVPYVEELRRQERQKNGAMRAFLDLFNHRLVSLFYRAWERSRPDVLCDLGEASAFEAALLALIGAESETALKRLPFDGRDLLARSGLLAMRPASASALCGLVQSLCGIPARVEQFLPSWYEIDREDRTRLGQTNSRLGDDINLGNEVCLAQSRFRIRLGPMDFATYRHLLPGGQAFDLLASVVRLASGPEFDFDFTLVLHRDAVPRFRLGEDGAAGEPNPCRLGWSTWINNDAFERDADDAVFTPSLAHEEARDSLEMRP